MAQTVLSASATLIPFNRGAKQWGKLFPGSSRRFATDLSLFGGFRSKGLRFVASATLGGNGGVVEVSEGETAPPPRSYKWPDKKKPRVCILGGGFGGLYTALRLESLVWPDDKKPQVLSSRKVQLLLGYFVRCIRKVSKSEASEKLTDGGTVQDIAAEHDPEKLVLELQPAERGLQSQILEADLVLWTVGSKPLLTQLETYDNPHELPLNARGQAETDETLRVKGHPRIFAVGDSSALRDSDGKLLPATAQVAFQQADFAGWNLWAAINDRPLLPFRFQNLGEMMTLGRNDAALSPSFIEGLTLEGPIGHTARKIAYLIRLPTDEHRLKVGVSWLMKSTIESVALLQSTLTKVLSGS
ncbi:hypothetical protein L1049_021557 [Liquidambar formosana]|uniref:FAD/NAD(P)-binding domain-containing protein n=1 Tax=Liquidambar formosana TaxID=63359 RepID=A0AAP0N3G5_LIQFO